MDTYHLRRSEKAITDPAQWLDIIHSQKYMTLAMCKDNIPYLVTVNYGYDETENCFYFHCAGQGKKREYLAANPDVWGQIIEDAGYLDGKCEHAFRTVQFLGTVTFLEDNGEKERALLLMIEQLESDPDAVIQQQITPRSIERVSIGKIAVKGMSGKHNHVP